MLALSRSRRFVAVLAAAPLLACSGGAPRGQDSADARSAELTAIPDSVTSACAQIADVTRRLPGAQMDERADSFPAFTGRRARYGCVVRVRGPVDAAQPVPVLATTLPDSLGSRWQRDDQIVADGPAETIYGVWRGDVLCLVRVSWGRSAGPSAPRVAGDTYTSIIGCEARPDHTVPRS
jgi:hypothetical protein